MDSGTDASIKEEIVQPAEVVETETEAAETNPQVEDTEQTELYVDEDEGDQQKPTTGMTQEQSYAAFQKEKRKRKDKQEQIDKDAIEKESLRKELAELKAQVGNITRGEMPDPYDFDTKEDHYKALKEWEGTAPQTAQAPVNQEAQQTSVEDEAEFYLYQSEQALTKALPGYQKSKDSLMQIFADDDIIVDPKAAMIFLSNIAKQKGVDIAKAAMTIERIPSILEDIKQAGNNHIMIGDILEKAANKVKTRTKKPINTQPEPEINSTGAIDGGNEAVNKLRQQWVASPSSSNYNAYQRAKKNKVNK